MTGGVAILRATLRTPTLSALAQPGWQHICGVRSLGPHAGELWYSMRQAKRRGNSCSPLCVRVETISGEIGVGGRLVLETLT